MVIPAHAIPAPSEDAANNGVYRNMPGGTIAKA